MIYYNSIKFRYNKLILVDVKKAYDSVSRNKLKEIITYNFNAQEAKFLKSFIENFFINYILDN